MRVSSTIVACEEPLFAQMIERSLRRCPCVRVEGAATDADRLRHLIEQGEPDLVIIDDELNGVDWTAVREEAGVRASATAPRFLVVVDLGTGTDCSRVRRQGAVGCIDRQADGDTIRRAVVGALA